MKNKELNRPPYQFCDGGDVENKETTEKGVATQTVELPKVIKVGYTDPDGNKTVKELDVSGLTQEKLVTLIQKGDLMEKRGDLADINRRIENRAQEIAKERGTSVEHEVKKILGEMSPEKAPVIDVDAVKEGDITSVVMALDYEREKRIKLENSLAERDATEKEMADLYVNTNKAISETLEAFPNLNEGKFIAYMRKLKLDPGMIMPFGEILSELVSVNIDLDKLPKEKREALEAKIKAEILAPPPPPEGGAAPKAEKIEDIPTDIDGMMKRADVILKKLGR